MSCYLLLLSNSSKIYCMFFLELQRLFHHIWFNLAFCNMLKRKYSPTYIKYGCIAIEHKEESLPQCVVCMKTLGSSTMQPSLLKQIILIQIILKGRTKIKVNFSDLASTSSGSAWARLAQFFPRKKSMSSHCMMSLSQWLKS